MNGYEFEAKLQPDRSYIMSLNGKQYRCKDWEDVCRQYNKHTEGKNNGREEGITTVSGQI